MLYHWKTFPLVSQTDYSEPTTKSCHPRPVSVDPLPDYYWWRKGPGAMIKEPFRSLAPGIYLIIVRPSRKSCAFGYESFYPRLQPRVGQIPVSRLQLWTGPGGARHLAAFGVHLNQTADF